jgi:oligoribonuclease
MSEIAGIILDLETTGLNAGTEHILEIGMMAIDQNLESLGTWATPVWDVSTERRIGQLRLVAASAPESEAAIVTSMHRRSGLFIDASMGGVPNDEAQRNALRWLDDIGAKPQQFPLSGSTIEFDRKFLFRWMPDLDNHFHYRTVNASSFKETMKWFAPDYIPAGPKPEARKLHRVLSDCEDTRRELQWYVNELLR